MKYSIVPITIEHVEEFNQAVGMVARERKYLCLLDAPPLEESRKYVAENIRSKWPQFIALDNDKVIGWCDITSMGSRLMFAHSGILGMGVTAPYRGKGIGKVLITKTLEAAKAKGLTRIELLVRESNKAAIALYEKVGFVFEGLKRNATYLDGKYENDVCMGLLFSNSGLIPDLGLSESIR